MLDPAILNRLLRYNRRTGKLHWRRRPGNTTFNTQFAGKEALACPTAKGYLHGTINGVRYKAHRVIVAMVTGEWPDQVDHENGRRADNRWKNLRVVDSGEQAKNKKLRADNTSGHVGVGFHKAARKWQARVGTRHIGLYPTFEAAVAARRAAAADYHPNHGKMRA